MKINSLLFLLLVVCFGASSKNFSVGWELWYPYQYHNNQQQLVGLDFDVFNAVIKKAKLTVQYTELPWKRHLQYIQTGEMDMAMGSSKTKEREEYAYFSIPYRSETVNLFVLNGQAKHIKLNTLSDLINSELKIGVEIGYYYGENYKELIKKSQFNSHIIEVIDLEENVSKLLKGRIDGFLVDPITMKAFTEKYNLQNEFEQHDLEIYHDTIHIMLSKKSVPTSVLSRINDAINELKVSGQLNKMIINWSKLAN